MSRFFSLFLILTPLIDYTYNLKFKVFNIFELSPTRIYKSLPILFFFLLLLLKPKKIFINKWIILLLLIPLPAVILNFSNFPADTFNTYLRFLSSFIFIFFAGKILKDSDIIFIFKSLIFVTLIPIIISYLQFMNIIPYKDWDYKVGDTFVGGRVSGLYEKPVAMMSYLIYTFAFSIFLIFNSINKSEKILYGIYTILVLGVVMLTIHRASIFIMFLIILYFMLVYNKKYLSILGALFLIILITFRKFLKIVFISSTGFVQNAFEKGSFLRGRWGFWKDYISNFLNSGIFAILFGKGYPVLDNLNTKFSSYGFNEPHSDIIRILYQYGIFGFLLFLFSIFIFLKNSIKFRKVAQDIRTKIIGDMGIIIGICLIIYSITIEPTRYPSFWWYYSIIISYILVNNKNKNESGIHN